MHCVDTSGNPRIPTLLELVREVSRVQRPQDAVSVFGRHIQSIRPMDGFLSVSTRGLAPGEYKITRLALSVEDMNQPHDPWSRWDSMPTHRGGFIGSLIEHDYPELIRDLRITDDPVLGDALAGYRSCVSTPLYDEGRAMNWSFSFRKADDGFTVDDLEDILLTNNLVGRATKQLVIAGEVARLNERLTAQLERVARIQRLLLPDRIPTIPGLDIAASYLTSDEAGGDYYDFFDLGAGRWGMFLGDVSGHGAGAATVMAMLQAILHTHPNLDEGPDRVLAYANHHLARKRLEGNFVTAFYGVYDTNTREISFANAGHHPPRRMNGDRALVRPLDGISGVPLCVLDDLRVETNRERLDPGETLVLFTDGVTEAFSPPPARSMFGTDGLDRTLKSCSGFPQCVIDSVHGALFEHTGTMDRDDDRTIIAMRLAD